MRALLVVVVVVHALIHVIGFVKAFHLARVEAMHAEISRPMGLAWLACAVAFFATATALAMSSRSWPYFAVPAVVLSQALIVATWSDAKAGTVANVAVLLAAILTLADRAPSSLRSVYQREIDRGLARSVTSQVVTEADIAALPSPLQTYLRRVGVVGNPRVHDVRLVWRAQMRRSPEAGWMTLRAEQYSFFDEPTRLFFMEGRMSGVPFVGLHRYGGGAATMQVRIVSVVPIVDGRGPKMDQSETVTMFNDMCVFAPATLLGAPITWTQLDARRVRGTFTMGPQRVSADLVFDEAGDLVDFVSDDRFESADGKTFLAYRWSTPLSDYRDFGGRRVAAKGDAIWRHPEGDFVYGRFEIESIEYNVRAAREQGAWTSSRPRWTPPRPLALHESPRTST